MNYSTQSSTIPKLSVIIITSDNYHSISKTVSYLQQQTILKEIELVIVAPALATLNLDSADLSGFMGYQVIEVGTIVSIGRSYAAGVRYAKAALVALAEDHCFPAPDWRRCPPARCCC